MHNDPTENVEAHQPPTTHSDLLAERRQLFEALLELQAVKSRVDADLRDVTGQYRGLQARFQSPHDELERLRREQNTSPSGNKVTHMPILTRLAAKGRSWALFTLRGRRRLAADSALLANS